MLNKDKIRIMSRCAMYEKAEGREDLAINRYYQGDYIRLNTLKTLIGATIGFVLCFGLYLVIHADEYVGNLFQMDLFAFGKNILLIYAVVMIVFAVISVVFYGWKYADAKKRIAWYYKDLQRLKEISGMEDDK
ncbi:hypothetical protein [Frisingicoccus sp.]|uniref:hypothetical protein n=1 Tax=Frisingicoccus sp. TaxID=1918627 RepID=UPI002EB4CFF9|nr:hypothetical protein [Frisingicoccus sp.]